MLIDQGTGQGGILQLSKSRNKMLEKDSWLHTSDSTFSSAFDSDPVKGASCLASGSATPCAHGLKRSNKNLNSSEFCGLDSILDDNINIVDSSSFDYPMGNVNHNSNNINYFENVENKDYTGLLCCDWPEIENFEDVDRMFRDDGLSWLSSDNIGGSGDVLNSDVKFPCLGSSEVENTSEDHDFSNGYSLNNSSMINAPIKYADSSWTSGKLDFQRSFLIGPDIADSKDEFIPQEQGPGVNDKIQRRISLNSHFRTGSTAMANEQKSLNKKEIQYEALQPVHVQQQPHASAPDSYSYSQNPVSYSHSDNCHFSDPSSVDLRPSIVKSEINDLTSVSPRDSSHASSQLQYVEGYVEGSPDPDLESTALAACEQRKKLRFCQSSLSLAHGSLKDGSTTVQPSTCDPVLGRKYESQCNVEGVELATPAELDSSNVQEISTMDSDLDDDISLEAASFHQLQLVMERLDLRTKLCIRDSLYRLAQSAERRHSHANLNTGCGEVVAGTRRYISSMEMETDTNPIDRSVAHLLFHRPSEPSTPAHVLSPFKSSSAVQGPVASPCVLADNMASEENVFESREGL